MVRLYNFMNIMIDTLEETCDPSHYANERPTGGIESNTTIKKIQKRGLKGRVIPPDVIRRFRSPLPIAVSQVHSFILN